MYKDKDKQREANREASQRRRDKGMTKGMTKTSSDTRVIPCDTRLKVIPEDTPVVILCETEDIARKISDNKIKPKPNRDTKLRFNVGEASEQIDPHFIPERTAQGNIRVSKPGDADYVPQCETMRAFIEDRPKRPETGKRGKDIKCFADLPVDVQVTIDTMSMDEDGKIDQTIKANRTAIAVNYQHLFLDRYHSTGVVI